MNLGLISWLFRIDQILTFPSLVDIPPVFGVCAVVAPGLVDSGSLVTEKWPPSGLVLGLTGFYAGCAM